jgi:hypothetical protein
MEIREIIDSEITETSLIVKFRIDKDSDDVFRSYDFLISDIEECGYSVLLSETFDKDFDENWDEDLEWEFEDDGAYYDVDEDELISFMNEYFLINNSLPEAESY